MGKRSKALIGYAVYTAAKPLAKRMIKRRAKRLGVAAAAAMAVGGAAAVRRVRAAK